MDVDRFAPSETRRGMRSRPVAGEKQAGKEDAAGGRSVTIVARMPPERSLEGPRTVQKRQRAKREREGVDESRRRGWGQESEAVE